MSIELTASSFVHFVASILGLLSAIILWMYPKNKFSPNKLLSLALLSLSLGLGISFLIESRLIFSVPHLYRIGNIFGLLFIPFSYLYVRSEILGNQPDRSDIIHFIPVLFFAVDYIPFYLFATTEKVSELKQDLSSLNYILDFNEGWITPAGFHLPFITILFTFYWILQLNLLVKSYQQKKPNLIKENKPRINWLIVYMVVQVFIFLPYFIMLIFDFSWMVQATTQISAATLILLTFVLFLIKPKILYGEKQITPGDVQLQATSPNSNISGPDRNSLEPELTDEIYAELKICVKEKSVFLIHGYTLSQLAKDTGYPYHQISAVINNYIGMNFNDYINLQRIEFCKNKMKCDEWQNLTLEAIAYECGFNNRNSFTLAFKKFTGTTPSKYVKQIDNDLEADYRQ